MERGPRRRRRSRPLVATFLRDPGSGRVYRRGKLIGQGAFSRCYKLTDLSTSAMFALKVVPRAGGGAGRLRPRGKSLAHVLRARQTLTEPEVRYYLRGLASGLRYLHRQRIVHRDLKPSECRVGAAAGLTGPPPGNFFLSSAMVVKIGDLGLAARVGPGGCCRRVLCGTPNFLAPEVISRKGHSCQSDVWALGCTMYLALTGTPPFPAGPLSETYRNIRAGCYPEPAHLSASARSLIARLLAPDPVERPGLDRLLQDDFFTQGFTPDRLPAHSCHCPPVLTVPPPLGRLFRKVGQLLLSPCGPPCPFTPREASGPGGDGPEPSSMERGSEASLSEGGASCPEAPIRLLSRGTLQSDLAGPEGSWQPEVAAAIRNLQLCLDTGPPALQEPPGERRPVLWAPEWVDYSHKYGFGYQLADGGCGVLLRDGSHMALRPPGGQVCYLAARGALRTFALRAVPAALGAKLAVLRLLSGYLRQRLRQRGAPTAPAPPAPPGLCLLRFLTSEEALLLLFSDGTVQVSFGDQAHLVLSGQAEGLWLSHWEGNRPGPSCSLGALRSHGCTRPARQRLRHAILMLQSG